MQTKSQYFCLSYVRYKEKAVIRCFIKLAKEPTSLLPIPWMGNRLRDGMKMDVFHFDLFSGLLRKLMFKLKLLAV